MIKAVLQYAAIAAVGVASFAAFAYLPQVLDRVAEPADSNARPIGVSTGQGGGSIAIGPGADTQTTERQDVGTEVANASTDSGPNRLSVFAKGGQRPEGDSSAAAGDTTVMPVPSAPETNAPAGERSPTSEPLSTLARATSTSADLATIDGSPQGSDERGTAAMNAGGESAPAAAAGGGSSGDGGVPGSSGSAGSAPSGGGGSQQDNSPDPVVGDDTSGVYTRSPQGTLKKTTISRPNDLGLPEGPGGVAGPGAIAFSHTVIRQALHDRTPTIGAWSESAQPGDTLLVTGVNLDRAAIRLWTNSLALDINTSRTAHDRMQVVIPAVHRLNGQPATFPHAVMLAAPIGPTGSGTAVRVNGPIAWWMWPGRIFYSKTSSTTLRVFGKNLRVADGTPVAYIEEPSGKVRKLTTNAASPYELHVILPAGSPQGQYRLWVHNGTGGDFGWSEPLSFSVLPPATVPTKQFAVEDYRDPGETDDEAVQDALQAVVANGGGVLLFAANEYNLSEPLILPVSAPITLRGSGRGTYDAQTGTFGGSRTVVYDTKDRPATYFILMHGNHSSIRSMSIVSRSEGGKAVVSLRGQDQSIEDARVVKQWTETAQQVIQSKYEGVAHHVYRNVEIITAARSGIRIEDETNYVWINACTVLGGHRSGSNLGSNGVHNRGGSNMLLEGCSFASVNRTDGLQLNRACLLYHHSIRNCAILNNTVRSTGPHPSSPGGYEGSGELILLHVDPYDPSVVSDVVGASQNGVTVKVAPDDCEGRRQDWIVFVARGRGTGQWRPVGHRDGNTLMVNQPWEIVPDESSKVIVTRAFRNVLVYGNDLNPDVAGNETIGGMRTVGIWFYHCTFNSIAAGNTIQNTQVATAISADPATPSCWNEFTTNQISSVEGYSRDAAYLPSFYSEHARGTKPGARSDLRHIVALGNAFRNNDCRDGQVAAQVGWLRHHRQPDSDYNPSDQSGLAMSLIENNQFRNVDRGVLISAPANWVTVRSNDIQLTSPRAEKYELHQPDRIIEPLVPTDDTPYFD